MHPETARGPYLPFTAGDANRTHSPDAEPDAWAVADPEADTAFTLASALLGRFVDRLTALGTKPARAFVFDGVAIPADDCCDGLAWVRVVGFQPTDGSNAPYSEMRNLPATATGATITLELGILRCAPILDEEGQAPDPDDYTASALQSGQDRQQMRMAIICDFPEDITEANGDGQIPGLWAPVDAGGCAGGYMTTTVGTTLVF